MDFIDFSFSLDLELGISGGLDGTATLARILQSSIHHGRSGNYFLPNIYHGNKKFIHEEESRRIGHIFPCIYVTLIEAPAGWVGGSHPRPWPPAPGPWPLVDPPAWGSRAGR